MQILLAIVASLALYVRLSNASSGFSYDYANYLIIIERISDLSISDLAGPALEFPYVVPYGVVPIEFGFAWLAKLLSLAGASPVLSFSLIASASLALRVYVMADLGVPPVANAIVNLIAVTLFEVNAIRLGVGVSLLMLGMSFLFHGRRRTGALALVAATSMHLQILIFVVPFLVFLYWPWISGAKWRTVAGLVVFSGVAALVGQLLPYVGNVKIEQYVARGFSTSAGLSVTSVLATVLLVTCAVGIADVRREGWVPKFWSAVLAAAVPSVVLLLTATDVAVVGDRAWQVAFVTLAGFFFIPWASAGRKALAFAVMFVVAATIFVNVFVRFPLSDVLSPPLPSVAMVRGR